MFLRELITNVNKNDMITQIVTLPRQFYTLRNVSMFSLLQATGYFQLYDQISEEEIRAALVRCPECVEEWTQYSEDKRTSGWYIIQDDEGRYEVGSVAENGERSNQIWLDSRLDACASFVRHELESIRLAGGRGRVEKA